MKKWMLSVGLLILATSSAWGMQFQSSENLYFSQSELADEDFYIAGEQVGFLGNALQDLFVAASSKANIGGTVVQDLNMAVVEGDVTAKVGEDLHVMANQIALNGIVGGSTLVLASDIFCKSQSRFDADVWLIGHEVHFGGIANDRLHISAGKVIIDGTVAGALQIEADSITIGRQARIMGPLKYTSGKQIKLEQGAYVQNRPVWEKDDKASRNAEGLKNVFTIGKVIYRLTVYAGLLALGFIVMVLLPQPMRRYALVIRYQFWPSLGWGVLTALGIFIGLLILIITIIGIPFAIVLGVMSFAALIATAIGMGYLLGLIILKPAPEKLAANLGAFALGFTILAIIEIIPVLGDLVGLVVMLVGLGALWLAKNFVEPQPVIQVDAKKEIEKPKPIVQPSPPVLATPVVKKKVVVKKETWQPAVPAFKKAPTKKAAKLTVKKTVPKKTQVKKVTKVKKKTVVKAKRATVKQKK